MYAKLTQQKRPKHFLETTLQPLQGISDVTLYTWRKNAVSKGVPVPGDGKNPDQWKPENQLAVIIETAAMNEAEKAEYCRKKGLFAEQIQQWKEAFINSRSARPDCQPGRLKAQAVEYRKDKQTIKKLGRELNRKDKALAETAALLVLTKKGREIWGAPEDDQSLSRIDRTLLA